MHIREIQLHNFKSISDFKAEFNNGVYLITGENEVGKSTLLGAIASLLTGERSDNLLKQGEKNGSAKMKVENDKESYEVELRFSEKMPRGTIRITMANGMQSDTVSMIQQIFGYQDFDAHEFTQWSLTAEGRRKQVDLVRSLLPEKLNNEIDDLATQIEALKEERKEANIHLKAAKQIVETAGMSAKEAEKYTQEIPVGPLYEKKNEADKINQKRSEVQERIDLREESIKLFPQDTQARQEEFDREIQELEERVKKLKNDKQVYTTERDNTYIDLTQKQADAKQWLEDNPIVSIAGISDQIKDAEENNDRFLTAKNVNDNVKKVKEKEKQYEKLDNKIKTLSGEREDLIKKSKLPIAGLSFTNDGLLLGGIPYRPGDVSTSQEIEIAAKLIIAKNPTTKVFRIARGESLGGARLKSIIEFAKKEGYQGFIEEVRREQSELKVEEYSINED